MSKLYSPKKKTVYSVTEEGITADIKCTLVLKWELKEIDENKVVLTHRNITLTLSRKEFDSNWEIADKNKKVRDKIGELYRAGYTQLEISKKLGISQATVCKYRHVKSKELDVDMLCSLADNGWCLKQLRTEAEYQTKRSYTNDEIIKILAERGYGLAE